MELLLYILFGVTVVLVLVIIYLLIRRKKYTRERFAFYSIFLLASMAGLFVSHIFTDNSFVIIIYKILNKCFDLNLQIPYTDWTGKAWSLVIYFIFASTIFGIFKTWSGGKSDEDLKAKEMHKEMTYVEALIRSFKSFNIEIVNEVRKNIPEKGTDFTYFNISQDWHTQVKEIFSFISTQYQITKENWHSEQNIYISKYDTSDIAIFCTLTKPADEIIQEKINFLTQYYHDKEFKKIIVAIQNHSVLKEERIIGGFNVEFRYKHELLCNIVKFDEYFDFIRSEFDDKEITSGDELKLKDIYVEQSAVTHISKESKKQKKEIANIEEFILKWANNKKTGKHIALLGEYGQGKSVLSLKIAYELIKSKSDRIPIIIELRGKSPKNETLLDILASWASRFNINAKAVEKLLEEGKLVVILEGFDEMDLAGDKYARRLHFKRLVEFMRYEKSKVLITGRPNLFFDTNEMEEFLAINQDINNLFYCTAVILKHLSLEQIKMALRNVNEAIREEMLNILQEEKRNTNFKDLISRASTLYQASIIWDKLDKQNINSASVINQFIKHSYQRQVEKFNTIGRTGIEPILTIKEREYFTLGIAVFIIKNDSYSNQISNHSLIEVILKLFYNMPEEVSNDHVNSILLSKRLADDPHKIETIFNDVRASGILVKDLTKNNYFKFAHKSFLEFLFAFYFSHYKYQNNDYYTKVVNSITNSLNMQDIYKIELTDEIIQFISELLLERNNKTFKENELAKKLLKVVLPSKLINSYPRIFLHKHFRVTINALSIGILFLIFLNVITYKDFFSSGKYILFLLIMFLPVVYFHQIIQFSKIRQPMKIWHKTCKASIKDDCIHSVICDKTIEYILGDSVNDKIGFEYIIKKIKNFILRNKG
jgi:DNA replication protein DnaC